LTRLTELYLSDNRLEGPAGSFLCIATLSGTINLHLQSNSQLSCIETCAASIAGTNRDASTPVGSLCVLPSSQPSNQPSIQPTRQPSNQPTQQPTSQPTSSPSDFEYEREVFVTRLDDFIDVFDHKYDNAPQWDLENFCTTNNWQINNRVNASAAKNCTLRLAFQYCLFYIPWSSPFVRPNNPISCKIVFPKPSRIIDFQSLGSNISISHVKSPQEKFKGSQLNISSISPIRIHIDFQNSTILLRNSFLIHYSTSYLSLEISNVKFVDNNYYSNNLLRTVAKICNIYQLLFENVEFQRVFLIVSNVSELKLRNVSASSNLQYKKSQIEIANCKKASIIGSTFYNCSSKGFGGALSGDNIKELYVEHSRFYNNKAKFGAAIALNKIEFSYFNDNYFVNNRAFIAGTVFWIYNSIEMPLKPNISASSNRFVNNFANDYGPTVASSFYKLNSSVKSIYVTNYASGYFPIQVEISAIDFYGQIIPYNNVTVLAKLPDDHNKPPNNCAITSPVLFGTSELRLIAGKSNFSRLGVTCHPGGKIVLEFVAFGQADNYNYNLDYFLLSKANAIAILPVSFRRCFRGEIFDIYSISKSTCSECQESYSLSDNFVTQCSTCPKEALDCHANEFLLAPGILKYITP
jgi:hypothetical protein